MRDILPPFVPGSISLRLYPHNDLPADEIVTVMRAQAAQAAEVGFDGVMTSEHHGGFGGYMPNPVQMSGWLLEAMPRGWAAPCPLLLPLRPWALVAEELADGDGALVGGGELGPVSRDRIGEVE